MHEKSAHNEGIRIWLEYLRHDRQIDPIENLNSLNPCFRRFYEAVDELLERCADIYAWKNEEDATRHEQCPSRRIKVTNGECIRSQYTYHMFEPLSLFWSREYMHKKKRTMLWKIIIADSKTAEFGFLTLNLLEPKSTAHLERREKGTVAYRRAMWISISR